MFQVQDVHSLTDFQRHVKEHLKTIKRTGRPEILTINGRAEVVVQDAASYQKFLEVVDRAEAIAGIERGLASVRKGEGVPLEEALSRLEKGRKSRKR